MEITDIDHLGIVAGIIDQLGLEEHVNRCLGTHSQQNVSPGQGVKAMILNGLGFVSAPLYLYEDFFVGKATSHLLGDAIESKHLNDDFLGRQLDKIWDYGPSELFSIIAMSAYRKFGLELSRYHLDSSSISVHGAYEDSDGDEGSIAITHGYSKDHRPDLKQFIIEMISCNDGEVPLAFEVSSGNQSDKAVFAQRLKAFAENWDVHKTLVADSALYTAENLRALGSLHWLTRVPLTLTAAQQLVTDLPSAAFVASEQHPGYRLSSVCSTYGGVKQLWVVVENTNRVDSDCQHIDKQVSQEGKQAEKAFRAQCKIDFSCAQDAQAQAQALAERWRYHQLSALEVIEHAHYPQPGRPKIGVQPTHFTYRIQGTVVLNDAAITQAKRKAGRFILATNALEAQMSAEQVLSDYKGQQAPERGFAILKDPLFFTSSVFLKTPERIAALAMVMGLSLMVYTLAQRQLRLALQAANETLPNQLKRPTQKPTLRWIFQCFQAVHLIYINGRAQVSNLTPLRLKILSFFGAPCQKYYLIC